MNAGAWTSLEIAKLAVAALTPLLVLTIGLMVARSTRRIEQAQWASRTLIEKRLELFDKMAEPLNDLFCFFRLVGDFQAITPPDAIARKRGLDKLFFTHQALMSEEFGARYRDFINACFLPYTGVGHDARLKASVQRQRTERGARWDDAWHDCFVDRENLVTPLSTVSREYRALMTCFAEQVGATLASPAKPRHLMATSDERGAALAKGGSTAAAGIEAATEPFRDQDYSGRRGYDDRFLGIPVPMPRVRDTDVVSHLEDGSHALPYEHFSIVQHKDRRLALLAVANVDAAPSRKRPEPGRDYSRRGLSGLGENDQEKWFTDPRIPAAHQLPDRFFTRGRASFDRGHIVPREDVAWGHDYDELGRASRDTFHVTNCSPQVARFNLSNLGGVWGQLENLILAQARSERCSVIAGPVLRSDDPVFRGVDDDGTVRVQIPRRFWKIVVARSGDELQSFAFVLDQDLAGTDLGFAVDELWQTRMISLPDLSELVELLEFPPELLDSDQIDAPAGKAVRAHPAVEGYRARS
jgi:DNA/RNA endonuclease G (NUC1)